MSAPINDGGPAFPHPEIVQTLRDEKGYKTGDRVYEPQPGMTLRDYFAAAALTGLAANPANGGTWESDAKGAYLAADAMLKQREAQP